jgi:ATP-binding cassette subfamily B multidrug efflux pump
VKLIWDYMKKYLARIFGSNLLKFLGTLGELSLPYILEYIIDKVVPEGKQGPVLFYGSAMLVLSFLTREFNVWANRTAVAVGRDAITDLRHDLFCKTLNFSGSRFDAFGLPSLQSRMTSDSYNVQDFMVRIQTIGIRAPIMLVGGVILTLTMDVPLSLILIAMIPLMSLVTLTVSARGIPMYAGVQACVDRVVSVLRENISGIRVIKALSREEHETERFRRVNEDLTARDIRAGSIMALPGPFMELCLNVGLTIVVLVGARRVDAGQTEPGVILAFLSYFNLILNAIRGLNRIFVMYSKASASAGRIAAVLSDAPDQPVLQPEQAMQQPEQAVRQPEQAVRQADRSVQPVPPAGKTPFIVFDHVSFNYGSSAGLAAQPPQAAGTESAASAFAGGHREKCLDDICFSMQKGESLGIIGATGCGKTTIVNLLMRFYDADSGTISIGGQDVRTFGRRDLRRRFGVAFQNDIIFADTLRKNIDFGRDLTDEEIEAAAADACAADFIGAFADRYAHRAEIRGANLSGGQKQRILVARALAAHPEILILDDSSSALDYATDARLRRAIAGHYADTTLLMVAQRASSIMHLDHIMVMEDGRILAFGTHRELLKSCRVYREICKSQMGDAEAYG